MSAKFAKTKYKLLSVKTGKILGAGLDVLEYEKTSFETLFASELPEAFQYLINGGKVG